jgi:hypothetical protein
LVEQSPDLYLDEIQEQLLAVHNVDTSLATISCTLHHLGYSSKRICLFLFQSKLSHSSHLRQLSRVAAECCEEACLDYLMKISKEPVERLVFTDESAVNILTTYRANGWALKGLRARKQQNFARGIRSVFSPSKNSKI